MIGSKDTTPVLSIPRIAANNNGPKIVEGIPISVLCKRLSTHHWVNPVIRIYSWDQSLDAYITCSAKLRKTIILGTYLGTRILSHKLLFSHHTLSSTKFVYGFTRSPSKPRRVTTIPKSRNHGGKSCRHISLISQFYHLDLYLSLFGEFMAADSLESLEMCLLESARMHCWRGLDGQLVISFTSPCHDNTGMHAYARQIDAKRRRKTGLFDLYHHDDLSRWRRVYSRSIGLANGVIANYNFSWYHGMDIVCNV